MKRLPHVRWFVAGCLLLLPTVLYWNTLFHRYGFRDDYSVLREATEEPGKVMAVCAMQGRPLYGALVEGSFALLRGIDDLKWLRLLAALLLGAVAMALFRLLRDQKWDRFAAALLAALVTVLPGAQLLVSWTVGWPLGLALLLALAAFASAERAGEEATGGAKLRCWLAAVLFVAASALIYQPNSLFYLVPLAAGLWPRRRWVWRHAFAWFARHLVTLGAGLGTAFAVMTVAYAQQWVPVSPRVGFEDDLADKLGWFLASPLQNALALIVLNDDDGSRAVHRIALLMAVLLLVGIVREWHTRGWRHGVWWTAALAVLLLGSFSVNLLAADRWPAYRVLLPLTGVVAVFLTIALLTLGSRRLARAGLALTVLAGLWTARRQAFELVAWPQGLELALIEQGAARIAPGRAPRIFVVTPTPFDRVTEHSFRDEFGSLSTDSDWVPKEMLRLVMRARHPEAAERYSYAAGRRLPPGQKFDVVIDLRRLREFRRPRDSARLGRSGP